MGRTVVLSPLRDNNKISGLNVLLLATYDCLAGTGGEEEVLIDVMDLK